MQVQNFLWCMELRTGGLVIGTIHTVFSTFAFLLGVVMLLVFFLYDCVGYRDHGPYMEYILGGFCNSFRGITIPIAIVLMLLSIGLFLCSAFCIRGMLQRNHTYVRPMMVLMGVFAVLSLLEVFSFEVVSIIPALATTLAYAYQYVVMYSIHYRFENEYMNTGPAIQYQPPIGKD